MIVTVPEAAAPATESALVTCLLNILTLEFRGVQEFGFSFTKM